MPPLSEIHSNALKEDFLEQATLMLGELVDDINQHYGTDVDLRVIAAAPPRFHSPEAGHVLFGVGKKFRRKSVSGHDYMKYRDLFRVEITSQPDVAEGFSEGAPQQSSTKVKAVLELPKGWLFRSWNPITTYEHQEQSMDKLPTSSLLDSLKYGVAKAMVQKRLSFPQRANSDAAKSSDTSYAGPQ